MTIIQVRDELAERLEAIAGLRVHDYPPETLPELPAAIIQPGEPLAEYHRVMGADDVFYRFSILLLTRSADDGQAWEEAAGYVTPSGAGSVPAAVEQPAVAREAAVADWFRVVKAGGAGRVAFNRAAYWGITFQVMAYVSGPPSP